jgi:GT2 family glycosyltransferase
MTHPRIAVIYLSFHCEPYMPMVLPAMEAITYPQDRIEWVIVDNPHPVHGSSVGYLRREVLPKSGVTLPSVTIIENTENLGFAGGNNRGAEYALAQGFDYVFFLNNDAYPSPDAFEQLVAVLEADKTIGIAQSMILLHQDKKKINSAGNAMHYLGFGYCDAYKRTFSPDAYAPVTDIGYASGAAMMVRADVICDLGAWDPDLFLYHEDMEWSLRVRVLRRLRVVLVRDSVFYHAYDFSRSITKYYWMERNRFVVWFLYLRPWTLFLIFPMMVLMEMGMWIFAFARGWWREKCKVYWYWTQPKHWRLWYAKRRRIQGERIMNDAELSDYFVTRILFQESVVESPVLKHIANPLMTGYWNIIKHLL